MSTHYPLLAVIFLALMLSACISAPVQQMSDARQAIAAAEEAGADDFAPELMEKSRLLILRAEREIKDERFAAARYHAIEARKQALEALAAEPQTSP